MTTHVSNMADLVVRRESLVTNIGRCKDKIDALDIDQAPDAKINSHLSRIYQFRQEGDVVEFEMKRQCVTDDERKLVAAEFTPILNELEDLIDKLTSKTQQTSSGNSSSSSNVKLPTLNLPTFNGNVSEWLSFHDLFVASVHNLTKLSGSQKLQYLKAALKDEASKLIASIQVTDDNYIGAWNMVLARYQNKRKNIFAHLRRLFAQPTGLPESAANLRKLHDTTLECVRALKVLGCQTDHWDEWLVFFVAERLDSGTRCLWERSLDLDSLPTFEELCKFVNVQANALAESSSKSKTTNTNSHAKSTTASHHTQERACHLCGENHPLFRCEQFKKLTPKERSNKVRKLNLCIICFRKGEHDCPKWTCRKCDRNHNTMLHFEKKPENTKVMATAETVKLPESVSDTLYCSDPRRNVQVLLSTILVKVQSAKGQDIICRALLDPASESSFISENCYQKLGLQKKKANVVLTGLSQAGVGSAYGSLKFKISSLTENYTTDVEALILSKVTGTMPKNKIDISGWTHIHGLKLADPKFHQPGNIDILLAADIWAQIFIGHKQSGPEGSAMAYSTHFGWVLSGHVEGKPKGDAVTVFHTQCDLDSTLKKFWEVEELPVVPLHTPEEKRCEKNFEETHSRDLTGRYIVQLPFKADATTLGESRTMAVKRFNGIERRLAANPVFKERYVKFMSDYLSMGHMELIKTPSIIDKDSAVVPYYIPHHFVDIPNRPTKFRVVFDASAKTSSGVSLNSITMVGPKLQDDLVPLLLRFRTHAIALTADISKMYRQILIVEKHRDFQRIVWRESPDQPLQEYRLRTVTYGTASAPYLATKCLQQLAIDEGQQFPLAAEVLKRDFYMDDLLSGTPSTGETITLRQELSGLTDVGKLPLLKWSSNSDEVLETIPVESRANQSPLTFDTDETTKILGIGWNPKSDKFFFEVNPPTRHAMMTKRTLLSDLAKTFDPLGWLSPITIKAKITMQNLWTLPLTWDSPLPDHIIEEWSKYCQELPIIGDIRIPRYVINDPKAELSLHGFCDASSSAYSAVVYIRSVLPDEKPVVTIVMAKTKVAPIKTVSVPRLELCGAVLLSRLIKLVIKSFNMDIQDIHAWTDSTLVLDWLGSYPNRWKTFVANRVSTIQDEVLPSHWHHIKGEENPADCASRGISPAELRDHPLWWHGPPWLSDREFNIPIRNLDNVTDLEEKTVKVNVHVVTINDLVQRFSSLNKLKRVIAYCLRFVFNATRPVDKRILTPLSQKDINAALIKIIKGVQRSSFPEDIKALVKNKPISPKSKLRFVDPYLDENGTVRVGGRLRWANLPEDAKHPFVLPRQHPFTQLVVAQFHRDHLHAGPQLTLAAIRQQFWILCGRDVVHHFIRRCIPCHRQNPRPAVQMMAQLPRARVTSSPAFLTTGVDYAGPFTLRVLRGRGQKRFKGYISLFVCFVTKAIHLELVDELSTNAFIGALKRFIARRGKPNDIHSDCGTNFVGADKELSELFVLANSAKHNDEVAQYLSSQQVNWHRNPPSAPHFGGLWEAGVKSIKHHLKRIMGLSDLNYIEMNTMITQIEACVNSRPLNPMSNDPNDLEALTPGHFLIGRPLTAVVEPDYTLEKVNRLSRWQMTQQLFQHFWRRWSTEFLAQLQHRPKWHSPTPNLEVGDLVLIKEDNLPPLKWKLGRILILHPGKDNHVRVVTLKTCEGELKRPIVKLCPLPID